MDIDKLLANFSPKELLIERGNKKSWKKAFGSNWLLSELEDWIFTDDAARDRLLSHFQTTSLKGFGVENMPLGIIASGAVLYYLDITEHHNIEHITSLARIEEERSCGLISSR